MNGPLSGLKSYYPSTKDEFEGVEIVTKVNGVFSACSIETYFAMRVGSIVLFVTAFGWFGQSASHTVSRAVQLSGIFLGLQPL